MRVFSGSRSAAAYKSVVEMGYVLGMTRSWSPDIGQLEDAIGGTLMKVALAGRLPADTLVTALDCSALTCHGLSGIFGSTMVAALQAKEAIVMLTVEFYRQGERLIFDEYLLTLAYK